MNSAWDVSEVQTSDYTASLDELVQVDMGSKAAPDMVTITMPIATLTNKGRSVQVVTTNQGGTEDGSILRIAGQGQRVFPTAQNFCDATGYEVMTTLTSTGSAWLITGLH